MKTTKYPQWLSLLVGMGCLSYPAHAMENMDMSAMEKAPQVKRIIQPSESKEAAAKDSPAAHAAKHADPTYICPMHPQIQQGEPGNCPICGMALVLKKVQTATTEEQGLPSVSVSSSVAQSMGVRIGKVKKRNLAQTVEAIGYVQYDEEKLYHIHARSQGWVVKPKVLAVGEPVKSNQVLAHYYSPDIHTAQEDYLTALRSTDRRQQQRDMLVKLRVLGTPKPVIKTLENEHKLTENLPITSPSNGVITAVGAQDGMYITPTSLLYSIADLSSVWVMVDIFPEQVRGLKVGGRTVMQIEGLANQEWSGKVDYIYPELDPKTRTVRVRLKFENKELALKPNMLARVKIINKPVFGALSIPREAIIPVEDGYRVVKVAKKGEYQPVEVELGARSKDKVEITSGLAEDDEVVLSAQFLLDSESNLQASFLRMSQ